jgi:hypothetical protein
VNQNLGTALQLMGKYRESEEHFERALHLLGLSLKTGQARRLGLGSALTLLGSALTLSGSALTLSGSVLTLLGSALTLLGSALTRQGQP